MLGPQTFDLIVRSHCWPLQRSLAGVVVKSCMYVNAGERFVVFAREGEQEGPDLMEGLVETYFGASMIYANPPSGLERPCSSPATGFHSLKAKYAAPHQYIVLKRKFLSTGPRSLQLATVWVIGIQCNAYTISVD